MMKGPGKGKKGEWPQGFGKPGDKGKGMMSGAKGDFKGKGVSEKGFGFDKGFGKGKGKGIDIVVSGCRHETVGSIIRGEYVKFSSNHGRPAYRKIDKSAGQEVQIYYWDARDGPNMNGWWFGASVGGDMVWSFSPGDAPIPPRTGWKVPFEGQVDPSLNVNVSSPVSPMAAPPQAVEVGSDTHITVQGCGHPVVGSIVNGSFIRNGENHGKPTYKKTEQTKDGVDVLIYFWNDTANPTFCGWWFGPEVGAEQVWAFNSSRLATAPLSGWKVPYDGPVDPGFHIAVDRKASANEKRLKAEAEAKQHKEVDRAMGQIRQVLGKLKRATAENLEQLEEELKAVMEKELAACGPHQSKLKEDCEKAVEQAKTRLVQLKEAQAKAEPLMKELASKIATAEAAIATLQKKVEKGSLEKAEVAIKACSQFIIDEGQVLSVGEGHVENMKRVQDCKKALRKAYGQQRHQEILARMATYDANKDGFLDKKDLKKYALSEFKFTLPDPVADKIIKHLTAPGAKGVAKDDFQRIKVQIGIARDRQIDLQRKKRMDELKDQLQDRIEKEVKTGVDEITTLNASIEEKWQKLKEPDVKSADKIAMLDKIDPELAQVREKISSQQQIMKQIKESTEITLKDWIQSQLSEFYSKLKKVDTSSQKIGREASRLRDTAGKQHEKELQALQKRGLEIIRQYQKAKDLLNDAVFEAMSASNGKERVVNETSFLNFFAKCGKECSNGEAVDIPSEEELRCLLCSWDSEGHLDEDRVQEILRRCMKVVNKTTLTDGVSSKSSVVRKLEVNEVLMLQSVPCKDSEIDVLRVKVQALNDGAEGWVTMSGNQGTEYLKEGGNIFKVKKETLLTEDLDITAGAKEKASQLKDTDRRLLIGELVEVKSPMQEQSGMKRFRCTALKDGASGWATVVNSQGTVYLEVK